MNGPHCPRCGSSKNWERYSDGEDAIICGNQISRQISVNAPAQIGPCGYVHWLRNAPAEEKPRDPPLEEIQRADAEWALLEKRARVRALVLAALHNESWKRFDILVVACEALDDQIEAIGKPVI